MVRERLRHGLPGIPVLMVALAALGGIVWLFLSGIETPERGASPATLLTAVGLLLLWVFLMTGFFMVSPNEAKVLQLFGDYVGTAKIPGLRYANPLYKYRKLSLRVRNFESGQLKVNDHEGNPIEIAAVVVWRVVETAEATFEVDDYEHYVRVQSEAALRNAATSYPYKAGVEVLEARISHLAYAPEIAAAMLQRQQAGAIIAARQRIVEGAVGMVEMALQMLSHKGIVTLDEERKAAMVSNLLVVLCGSKDAQPVVNTGTIHQ
jgi:regulator of protease activity HflC (stomatin/prohibitin superfamily)